MHKSAYFSAVLFAAFAALAAAVLMLGEIPGERTLLMAIHDSRSPALTTLIQGVTFLTSATPALGVSIFSTLLETRRIGRRPRALWPLMLYACHLISNIALRIAVGRLRPEIDYIPNLLPEIQASFQQFSFPSGHAGSAVVAWGGLALALHRTRYRGPAYVAAALLILGTSIGRIYLGVHWPSDVLGGLLLSLAWLTIFSPARLPAKLPAPRP